MGVERWIEGKRVGSGGGNTNMLCNEEGREIIEADCSVGSGGGGRDSAVAGMPVVRC